MEMDAAPRHMGWYRLAILLAPVLVLWRQDNPLFTPPGTTDSWVYLGYFRNLVNFKRDLFPDLYNGSRLPMLLPGCLVHSLLPPVAASVILHLGVLWVASMALFETLRQIAGARAAFLTVLLFCGNPQVWYAIGWDYFDGYCIAYCLIALAALTHAAAGRGRIAPVVAGVAIAGLVYSNLITVVFVPLLALHYAGIARVCRRSLRDAWNAAIVCVAAFAAVTAVLCYVNRTIDGTWWFYAPSLHTVQTLPHHNRWEQSPWTSHGLAPWLWVAAAAVVAAIVRLVRGMLRSASAVAAVELVVLAAAYGYIQPVRMNVLGLPFYSALLLPFVFLVVGTSFWNSLATMSARRFVLCCGVASAGIAIVWSDYATAWTPLWPHAIPIVATLGGVLLALAIMPRLRTVGALCGIAGLVLFASEIRYLPKRQNSTAEQAPPASDPHQNRRMLERVMDIRARIEAARAERPVRFWYDARDRLSDFAALNATYLYEYSMWPAPDRGSLCEQSPGAGTLLVAFGPPEVREQAQRALEGCGGSRGLVAKSTGVYANAALFSIERDWTRWRVARPGAGEIEPGPYAEPWPAWPEDGWKLLTHDLGAHMEHGSSGWELTTPASRYADAAAYGPLVVREGGTYTFSLHYAARSESFAFGVRGSDGGWLVTDTIGVRAALRWERTCTVKLAAGQQIRVEIANNRDHEEPTKLEIRGIRSAVLLDAR